MDKASPDSNSDADIDSEIDTSLNLDSDTDPSSDIHLDTDIDTDTRTDADTGIDADGNLVWARRAGGKGTDHGIGVTALSNGSLFVIGHFSETAVFGPGEENETRLSAAGGYDIFISKYNSDGSLARANRIGGILDDYSSDITVFSDGSALVTGWFQGTVVFGLGETRETELASTDWQNTFIARYNPDGTLAWAKKVQGCFSHGITTLSDGSALITGEFSGVAVFDSGKANEEELSSAGVVDIFVAKYNSDGTLAWAKRAGGDSLEFGDAGYSITALSDGSALITGGFIGTAVFGPGERNEIELSSVGGYDIFVAKYNSDGTVVWATGAGGAEHVYLGDSGYDIAALSDGSAMTTGQFWGTAVFGSGEANETELISAGYRDFFIAKHNPDGTLAWAKGAGGVVDSHPATQFLSSITSLPHGSALITGGFLGTAIFGLGEVNKKELSSVGRRDIFIAKYTADGSLAWVKKAGGNSWDSGYGVAALSDGSALVIGCFAETAVFGRGETNEIQLSSAGSLDIFIAKLAP
ncbi:MAG: hypothetical protein GY847_23895 [Proteobacteria bacterium]|nr:hypothetical protein [Pseudomonadota bacterium]